jgi:Tfp pilus assembly protein PilX
MSITSIRRVGSESAIALLTAVIFLLIIASLAAAAIYIMTASMRISSQQVEKTRAYYAAEASLVHNLNRLAQGQSADDISLVIDGKTYQTDATFTPNVTLGGAGQFNVTQIDIDVDY